MLAERFFQYLKFEKRVSPHTLCAYQNDLRQFSDFIKQHDLDFISARHSHIRLWAIELLDRGAGPKTVNRKLSGLRSFYKFLQSEQITKKNPMLLVRALKVPARLPVVIEEQKMDGLLDGVTKDKNGDDLFTTDFEGIRNRLIIELLYGTGMRLSELVQLKETDFYVYEQSVKVLGKRNKERIIPVNPSLQSLVKQYLVEKKSKNFGNNSLTLIVTNEGKDTYPKFIYRIVKYCLNQISASQKNSPHTLRHTFATSLLNHGADLNAIKELLGHASLAATEVYTHNSAERLKTIYKQAHPKA